VITLVGPRNVDEITLNGKTFGAQLGALNRDFLIVEQLTPSVIAGLKCDLSRTVGVSLGAPWIIKADVLRLFNGHIYNCHGAGLPRDRGGGGFSWQIMRGNKRGFALIHRVDEGIDTGEIVFVKEFIYENCRIPIDFINVCNQQYLEVLKSFIPKLLEGGNLERIGQPEYLSSYWPRLNAELHGWIDWSLSGKDICRFICAFDEPYCGAHTYVNGQKVYLKECHLDYSDGTFHPFQVGLIYRKSATHLSVCTTSGSLLVKRLLSANSQKMDWAEIALGDRFYTPVSMLRRAARTRAIYTATGLKTRESI
jgi:methionyl-tRNA formyltransferase